MAYKRANKKMKKSMPKSTGAGAVRKARSKPKVIGQVNVKALALAVSKINVNKQEKKRYHLSSMDQLVSQLKVVGSNWESGHYVSDITPAPSQGVGIGEMVGNKIRLMSSRLHFQFKQQSNVFGGPLKGTIYVIKPKAGSFDVPQIPGEFLNPNPFLAAQSITVYDNISNRNFDTMQNYQVIRKVPFQVAADSTGSTTQVMVKTFSFGIRYNRGQGMGMSLLAGIPLTDEIKILVVLDQGNQSTTVAGGTLPTGVITTGATTGLIFSYFVDHWYTDN